MRGEGKWTPEGEGACGGREEAWETSVRDASSKGHIMQENFREFSFGDTTVGDYSTWHPAHHLHLRTSMDLLTI